MTHLNQVIIGLGKYFSPLKLLSKQNHTMRHGMNNSFELKVRRYTAFIVEINDCLNFFLGIRESDKSDEMELNGIILKIMPNFIKTRHKN